MSHLVLAALTGLQAGQDLALYHLHPGVTLLVRRGLEVPRLPRQRNNGELKVLLLLCRRCKRRGGCQRFGIPLCFLVHSHTGTPVVHHRSITNDL